MLIGKFTIKCDNCGKLEPLDGSCAYDAKKDANKKGWWFLLDRKENFCKQKCCQDFYEDKKNK